jgi:hypothetical protein
MNFSRSDLRDDRPEIPNRRYGERARDRIGTVRRGLTRLNWNWKKSARSGPSEKMGHDLRGGRGAPSHRVWAYFRDFFPPFFALFRPDFFPAGLAFPAMDLKSPKHGHYFAPSSAVRSLQFF